MEEGKIGVQGLERDVEHSIIYIHEHVGVCWFVWHWRGSRTELWLAVAVYVRVYGSRTPIMILSRT